MSGFLQPGGGSLADQLGRRPQVDLANPRPLPGLATFHRVAGAAGSKIAQGIGVAARGAYDVLAHPSDPNGDRRPAAPAARPAVPAAPQAGLPDWAKTQVARGGGDPANFRVEGSQLVSARPSASIQADIAAHPPITTAPSPAAPVAAVPSIGVQGAAAQPQARPGVAAATPAGDPLRESMARQYRAMSRFPGMIPQGNGVYASAPPEQYAQHQAVLAQHIAAISHYDQAQAQRMQADPASAVQTIDAINANPARRATYLAGRGVDPASINALPQPAVPGGPAVHAGNLEQYLARPENIGVAGIVGDQKSDIAAKFRQLSQMPGYGDPSHPTNQAINAWVGRQRAADPRAWEDETSVPEMYSAADLGVPSWLQGPVNALGAASQWMFGPNKQARIGLQDNLRALQAQSPPGTVNPQ